MIMSTIAPNCITIENDDTVTMYSYNKAIAEKNKHNGIVTLDANYWQFSKTTGKHRNLFLNETLAITRHKIDTGVYCMENLNK